MSTEDLIRESLQRQADRAPAPGPVLAALHRPPTRRRGLALTVAAVVGVLLVVAGVFTFQEQHPTEPVPPAAPPVPIRYTTDWLPEGYTEQGRSYNWDGAVSRTWMPVPMPADEDPTGFSEPWVTMSFGPAQEGFLARDVVGGISGLREGSVASGSLSFTWLPDPAGVTAVEVLANNMPDIEAVLDRLVSSTRPDPTTTTSVPLLVGPGPYSVRGTPDDWTARTVHLRREGLSYAVELGSHQPTLAGEPVVVRGTRGIAGGGGLAVRVAPDRWLSIRPTPMAGAIPVDELVDIANSARIDPHADMSWLGTR